MDTRSFAWALRSALRQDPGRHPRRRNARLRDHRDGPAGGGNRAPRLLHPPHARRDGNDQPHHRRVSAASAETGPAAAGRGPQGRHLPAPHAPRRRQGPRAGRRGDDHAPRSSATASSTRNARTRFPAAIAAGTSQYGMQTFDQSIFGLFQQGLVSYDEALRWATNVDEFKLKVQGISTTPTWAATRITRFGVVAGPRVGTRARSSMIPTPTSTAKMLGRRELSEAQIRQRLARREHDPEADRRSGRPAARGTRHRRQPGGRGDRPHRNRHPQAGPAARPAQDRERRHLPRHGQARASTRCSAPSTTTTCSNRRSPSGFAAARPSPTSASSTGCTATSSARASNRDRVLALLKKLKYAGRQARDGCAKRRAYCSYD